MPEYDYDDLILNKGLQSTSTKDYQKLSPNDSDQWEMDVETTLDRMYHGWLGEKLRNGIWDRDEKLVKLMNEKGASFLISEIRPRFNINMQFSVLEDETIKEIVGYTGINIARVLKYDYWKYGIKPTHINNICDQITHALFVWLRISFMGGMREYKGDKTKTVINKQEINAAGGGVY